jgi:hypothetical protein
MLDVMRCKFLAAISRLAFLAIERSRPLFGAPGLSRRAACPDMHPALRRTLACVLALAGTGTGLGAAAQPAAAAPAFDVAYRAWEVVTGIARHDRDPALAGDCGKTFQAFAVPALRRQSKAQQDAAAVACHQQARALCASRSPAPTPDIASKCEEFR